MLDNDRYEQRIESVGRLVSAHLDRLVAEDSDRAAKALCEIALLIAFMRVGGVRSNSGRWTSILDVIAPRLRATSVLQRLLWMPSRASMFGVGHALVSLAGRPFEALDAVVADLARHPLSGSREVSPYEALESEWVLRLIGASPLRSKSGPLMTARPAHPLFMTEDDAYAFTHTVLYRTDLGRRRLNTSERLVASDLADAGVTWSLARADFDLTGEMLLAAVLSGAPSTPAAAFGLAVLEHVWDDAGFVPDRAMAGFKQDSGRDPLRLFYAIYHANLVGALLMTALLNRPGWRRPASRPEVDVAMLHNAICEAIGEVPILVATATEDPIRCAADLRIHLGMYKRNYQALLEGVRLGLCCNPVSSSTTAGLEWARLFARSLSTLGVAGGRVVAGEIAELHSSLSPSPLVSDPNQIICPAGRP